MKFRYQRTKVIKGGKENHLPGERKEALQNKQCGFPNKINGGI